MVTSGPIDRDLEPHTSVVALPETQQWRMGWLREARERHSPQGYRDVLRVKAY